MISKTNLRSNQAKKPYHHLSRLCKGVSSEPAKALVTELLLLRTQYRSLHLDPSESRLYASRILIDIASGYCSASTHSGSRRAVLAARDISLHHSELVIRFFTSLRSLQASIHVDTHPRTLFCSQKYYSALLTKPGILLSSFPRQEILLGAIHISNGAVLHICFYRETAWHPQNQRDYCPSTSY